MTDPAYRFVSLTSYARGLLTVYIVENPHECDNWTHLGGADVEIDGRGYWVKAVEYFAHAAPWLAGEPIGLLVKPAT